MKKFIKISSFLLAFAMIVTSFVMFSANNHVHAADKPVAAQTWTLDASAITGTNTPFSIVAGTDWVNVKNNAVALTKEGDKLTANGNDVVWVEGGVFYTRAQGGAVIPAVVFTAPADGTYTYNAKITRIETDSWMTNYFNAGSSWSAGEAGSTAGVTYNNTVTLTAGQQLVITTATGGSKYAKSSLSFTVSLAGTSYPFNGTNFAAANDQYDVYYTGDAAPTTIAGSTVAPDTVVKANGTDSSKIDMVLPAGKNTLVTFKAPACGTYTVAFYANVVTENTAGVNVYFYSGNDTDGYTELTRRDGYHFAESYKNWTLDVELEKDDYLVVRFRVGGYVTNGATYTLNHLNASFKEAGCTPATDYKFDANQHWQACANCGEPLGEKENHTGGTATCVAKKECTVCGETYGDFADHTPATDYSKDADYHWKECSVNGCGETIDGSREAHDFTNGNCVCGQPKPACDHANCTKTYTHDANGHVATWTCGKVDTTDTAHRFVNGDCVCGAECDHANCTKTYTHDANGHVATWTCGEVDTTDTAHDFTNGNCVCGEAKPVHTHDNCTKTYTNNGDEHVAEWSCGEVDANDTEHDFTNGNCVCGAKKPAPQTGDTAISISIALAAMAILGFAVVTKKRH